MESGRRRGKDGRDKGGQKWGRGTDWTERERGRGRERGVNEWAGRGWMTGEDERLREREGAREREEACGGM